MEKCKRYEDCQNPGANCEACSLSSYGRDCHNNPSGYLAYRRSVLGYTQQDVADRASINIRMYRKYERGEYKAENITAGILSRVAEVLGTTVDKVLYYSREQ